MAGNLAIRSHPSYDFLEPVDLSAVARSDSFLLELTGTRAFQRLRSIRFLGGIDYVVVRSPNGTNGNIRYTRYQHSLGVASLALFYCNATALPFEKRRLVCAAALLHDIGHAPLSHSLEPVFEEEFGLAHHQVGEDIITGRVPLGKEVHDVLRRNQIDIERLISILAGRDSGYHGFFNGPINFDTIEGIMRAWAYTKPSPNILSPVSITQAALWRSTEWDRRAVDEFWSYKDRVYHLVVNSRLGVLADFACQWFMRLNLDVMGLDDYFATEDQIFQKLPGLRNLLMSRSFEIKIAQYVDRPISYTARRFNVEPHADFFARDDTARYRQSKEICTMMPRSNGTVAPVSLIRDLFDDRGD